jgi:hypothetical protein
MRKTGEKPEVVKLALSDTEEFGLTRSRFPFTEREVRLWYSVTWNSCTCQDLLPPTLTMKSPVLTDHCGKLFVLTVDRG